MRENGVLIPVTVLQAGPVYVTQIKTEDNDGYNAVQVAYGDIRETLVNKPLKGHFAKAGVKSKRFIKEFKFDNVADYQVGQEIKVDIFAAGDKVDATAKSKGKGFRAIKRHGLTETHEARFKYHRHAGSTVQLPAREECLRVKMPGQMGNVKVTGRILRLSE